MYGIAEWFGRAMAELTSEERVEYAKKAQQPIEEAHMECPYRTKTFGKPMLCNKAGGVCALASYSQDSTASAPTIAPSSVCICPARLLEPAVFRRIGQAILGSEDMFLVREVPFLQNAVPSDNGPTFKAGRIDFVIVDKDDRSKWCAVETQSVYFSGQNMGMEFDALIASGGDLIMPVGRRRPDYRSSVPKRLSPQLMLKVPQLGRGKYLAVIVDEFVYRQMAPLAEVPVDSCEMTPEELRLEKLALSEVIWFIVALRTNQPTTIETERYTTLAHSIQAVDSALPIPMNRFTANLSQLIDDPSQRGDKVIPLFAEPS
ncbi:MAG: hypothetical protein C7B43_21010 [Sulfobacillus benefaciens]|uniref:Restriction endonuclease type II NotI domain-containing protein n=1 Tax=Sulfobacillus benefaciens TaxID=453960 RepID=A0A2T2WIF2_9FIRM|nr:MAG: hypothetical protein C7B43_21010 [Sulfobacillus benefaciens]